MKIRKMTLCALFAALLCVLAPLSVPIGPVPISLASFVAYLAGSVLGAGYGALSVFLYVLLGAFGLPVFAGWAGGLGVVAGLTGGYIVGFIPCAACSGLLAGRLRGWGDPCGMLLGTAVLYAVGTLWFILQTGNTLAVALAGCVLPFLPGDALKIAAASLLAPRLRAALSRSAGN